jgi:drug/metabolite transporter (DMT)-like permease
MTLKTLLLTCLTMMAFAANSILCRLALRDIANDPISFTMLRMLAGAGILSIFIFKRSGKNKLKPSHKSLIASVLLFSYALFFSLAYVKISAGTGALILFACVQLTMMIAAVLKKQKQKLNEKIGFVVAGCGFLYLILPGADLPSVQAAFFMMIAGVSWGLYSLAGQGVQDPILGTARNFIFTVPVILLLFLNFEFRMNSNGIALSILSGAVTSGLGYVLWYFVLKRISTTTAAIVQLSVPALAAAGGVMLLGETLGSRLIIASVMIFGGIYLKIK